jgi:hypothetical protein
MEVFTTSIHPLVDIPEGWNPQQWWSEKLPYAVSNPMWLHSTMAFADSMRARTLFGTNQKSHLTMRYNGRAIGALRDSISSGKAKVDDLSILTITSLMSTEVCQLCSTSVRRYS